MTALDQINVVAIASKPLIDLLATLIILTLVMFLIMEYNHFKKENIEQL